MKSRKGFVSNSSSTSFLIAVNKDKQVQLGILDLRDFDFLEYLRYLNREDCEDTKILAESLHESISHLKKEYGYQDGEDIFLDIEKVIRKKKLAQEKYDFAFIEVDYHDPFTYRLYDALLTKGKIVEILKFG